MQYQVYGKNGPIISRLGFGAMRLPLRKRGDWGSVNVTRSVELMRAALEAGINFIDTHHNYHVGNSETAVGRAVKGWKGPLVIQTKTPWYREEPREFFEKLLYEALEKLGVNCIDYLLHHSMEVKHWKTRGKRFIKFTDWAINRGLIRYRGFSSHETPANIKTFIDTGEFAVMLVSYNWMTRRARDVIAHAADCGMGVSIMNPIGGGTLATSSRGIMRLLPGARTAPEVALRYVLATPGVTCALSGMNTLEQLEQNIAVAGRKTPMTARQSREMAKRLARIEKGGKGFCTGCGYCMPCPHGVDIPANFQIWNEALYFERMTTARTEYARLKRRHGGDASAPACRDCGACEPKCPNKLPIREHLRLTHAQLG